jgi:antitoxin component YwqK of YwqJK toxin-antitoxin module
MLFKSIISASFFLISSMAIAQKNNTIKLTKGTLIDSTTNEPIPFANVSVNNRVSTVSDIEGKFEIKADTSSLLTVKTYGYYTKSIKLTSLNQPILLRIRHYPADSSFVISGKPLDTIYYKDKKIKQINYQGNDSVTFYESGQTQSKEVHGSSREWYENGKLKTQEISKNSECNLITYWYENGQMESCGTSCFVPNSQKKRGEWVKGKDWKYWDTNGKEIKN